MIWRDWGWRQRKKAKIAGIYLVLFALIGWGLASWLLPDRPAVPPPEKPLLQPLQVLEAGAIALRPGKVDLYARVRNPNALFGAATLDYTWRVFDRQGTLILTRPGQEFILPQSTKLLIDQAVSVPAEVGRVEIKLQPVRWVGIKEYVAPRLFVTRKTLKIPQDTAQGYLAVEGEVRNASDFDFDRVLVKVTIADRAGKLLAVGKHEIRTLVAGENRFFRVSWFDPIPGQPAQAQAVAETNVFLNYNFIESKGLIEPFQVP